jgi:hypothetical protein
MPYDPHAEQRLHRLWQTASDDQEQSRKTFNEAQVKLGEGRLAYFEKLAILSGGSVALTVSFVGSRSTHLNPPWLLHTGLVLLVLGMITSTARNWIWRGYYYFTTQTSWLESMRKNQQAKFAYIAVAHAPLDLNTGRPIDKAAVLEKAQKSDDDFAEMIKDNEAKVQRRIWWFSNCEKVAHILTLGGMLALVALALLNF